MLFWRMHRCARIIFILQFYLGQMTPQECVDDLVENIGHKRAIAEDKVRRPLYGGIRESLQLYVLWKEVVDAGHINLKKFHDNILEENGMLIEIM